MLQGSCYDTLILGTFQGLCYPCKDCEYLHTRNPVIIHSDIKPGNIMIDQQGDICLIDFNISILHDKNACVLGYSSNYCSPEQLMQAQAIQRGRGTDGITVDQRSDIYSTAATFYAVITGTVPQGSGRDRPLAQMPFLPYSREILRLLDKAMAPHPKDRYQDAREMLNMTQHLERLGERYGTYTVLRAVISVMGTALIAFGILCILQGRQTILKEELNQKYTDISLAYENDGATFEVYRDTAELLVQRFREGSTLICGGNSSGKTTLLNALKETLPDDMAVLVIQQADELTTRFHPDMMFLHSLPGTGESRVNYDLKDISIAGLTMDVDFFIIGEVKGAEAMYLLNAAYTGQICAATIHAPSADRAPDKLVDYAMYESRYSRDELMKMMDCFHTLIFMEHYKVKQIFSCEGYSREQKSLLYKKLYQGGGR